MKVKKPAPAPKKSTRTGKKSQPTSTDSPEKVKTVGPFDYINSIMRTKVPMIRGTENEELAEKGFNAFLTNRALSFHVDTVLYANEMNQRGHLDGVMQYDYHMASVRSMSRPYTWPKRAADASVESISEFYSVNRNRAREIYSIIGDDGVATINKKMIRGGTLK